MENGSVNITNFGTSFPVRSTYDVKSSGYAVRRGSRVLRLDLSCVYLRDDAPGRDTCHCKDKEK